MTMPTIVHRVKLLVATHGPAIAAVLAVIGLVAFAGAAWTVTHPPSIEVTDQVATHTVDTDVTTSTIVTGNSSLWDPGSVLADKPIYPIQSAPQLTIDMRTSVPPGQAVQVNQELTLVYQASKDGTVFWQSERLLVSEDRTVTDGVSTATATVDVRQVRDHLDEIDTEITGLGRSEAYLRLNVSYRTDDYSGTISKTAPLTIMQSGYWVGGSLDGTNTHQSPQTREVTQPPDTTKALGLGLLGFLSLGGAGGVVYTASRRLDPEAIADEIDRRRYREWVSAGTLSQFVTGQDVAMDSLKDLVDVAIDSNHRVVHDRSRELYAVVDGNTIYYYDPHHTGPDIEFEPEAAVPLRHDGGHESAFGGRMRVDEDRKGAVAPSGATPAPTDQNASQPPADDTAELSVDAVAVSREIAIEAGRAVAIYRLSTDEAGLVAVDVADTLAAACDLVDTLEVLPGHEPVDDLGIKDGVGFRAIVTRSRACVVKYVVGTNEPVTREALGAIREADGPKLRRVVSLGSPEDR